MRRAVSVVLGGDDIGELNHHPKILCKLLEFLKPVGRPVHEWAFDPHSEPFVEHPPDVVHALSERSRHSGDTVVGLRVGAVDADMHLLHIQRFELADDAGSQKRPVGEDRHRKSLLPGCPHDIEEIRPGERLSSGKDNKEGSRLRKLDEKLAILIKRQPLHGVAAEAAVGTVLVAGIADLNQHRDRDNLPFCRPRHVADVYLVNHLPSPPRIWSRKTR